MLELEGFRPLFVERKGFDSDIKVLVYNPMHDTPAYCDVRSCGMRAVYQVLREDIYDGEWQQSCMSAAHLGVAVIHVMSVKATE